MGPDEIPRFPSTSCASKMFRAGRGTNEPAGRFVSMTGNRVTSEVLAIIRTGSLLTVPAESPGSFLIDHTVLSALESFVLRSETTFIGGFGGLGESTGAG